MTLGSMTGLVESLLQPLSWVVLWLLGLVVKSAWMGRRRTALICFGLSCVLWGVGSTPLTPWLLAGLEKPYLAGSRQAPLSDAVVMMGGSHNFSASTLLPFNLGDAGDRPLLALELMRQGRAPVLVLGGAAYELGNQKRPDSELLHVLIRGWHLPAGRVILLARSQDTHDEAVQVAALARSNGWRRVVMVSSGFHLRRGEAALRKAGVPDVYAIGAEFNGTDRLHGQGQWGFLPDPERFRLFALWVHEELGWWYYRWKGWA